MTPTINIQYLTNFPKAIQKIDTIKWVLSQPAAKQTASPSNGTQEIKSDTPPQRRTFVNIRSLGKWRVGMNRPNKNVVIPPSVLPIVATQRAAQSEVTSFSKIAIPANKGLDRCTQMLWYSHRGCTQSFGDRPGSCPVSCRAEPAEGTVEFQGGCKHYHCHTRSEGYFHRKY